MPTSVVDLMETRPVWTPPTEQRSDGATTYVEDEEGNVVLDVTDPKNTVYPKIETPQIAAPTASTPQATVPTASTPQTTVPETETQTKQPYLVDWNTTSAKQAYDLGQHSMYDLIMDQQRWAQENNKPFIATDWMGLSKDTDVSKTKEENELDAKRAKRKEQWDAVGNFLTHLGNFVGAAGWGGAVKLEDPVAYSERQRKIKEAAMDRRNAYNQLLLQQIGKDRAEQRTIEKQLAEDGLIAARVKALEEQGRQNQSLTDAKIELLKTQKDATAQKSETDKIVGESRANANNATAWRRQNQPFGSSRSRLSSSTTKEDFRDTYETNVAKYPDEAKNYFGYDDNPSAEKKRQFNAYIKSKYGKPQSSGTGKGKGGRSLGINVTKKPQTESVLGLGRKLFGKLNK